MQDILDQLPGTIAFALLAGAITAALAFLVRLIKGQGAAALLVGLETFLTTAAAAFLSWLIIWVLMELGGNTDAAAAAFGTLFLIWPGLVDVIWAGLTGLFSENPLFVLLDAEALPWFAFAIGAGVGAFDGYRRIHKWRGLGAVRFVADVTWGLPLAVNALIMHIRNLPGLVKTDPTDGRRVTVHEDLPRQGAHRYLKGFRLKKGYAFTQGSVISNLEVDGGLTPTASGFLPLLSHETVHVFQNRLFGPLFWFTYIAWFIIMGIVGLIAAIFAKPRSGAAAGEAIPFWWAYMNNPWEVWAYTKNPGARNWVADGFLSWPVGAVIPVTVVVDGAAIALFFLVVRAAL